MPELIHVETATKRLDLYLSQWTHRSRAFIQNQIEHGAVLLNGQAENKPAKSVKPGDVIELNFEEEPETHLEPVPFNLEILFEDEHLVLVNKPQDCVVHPAPGYTGPTLVHYLLHHFREVSSFRETSQNRPGIVHRLDRGTSGVIAIAKHRTALERLSRAFKDREIEKRYAAIVWGELRGKGAIESSITRHPVDRIRMTSKLGTGRLSKTEWESVEALNGVTFVRAYPRTGRTHQIRVHLADAGYPIVGDAVYGAKKKMRNAGEKLQQIAKGIHHPFLHAESLKFSHPMTGELLKVEAPIPAPFEEFLAKARAL